MGGSRLGGLGWCLYKDGPHGWDSGSLCLAFPALQTDGNHCPLLQAILWLCVHSFQSALPFSAEELRAGSFFFLFNLRGHWLGEQIARASSLEVAVTDRVVFGNTQLHGSHSLHWCCWYLSFQIEQHQPHNPTLFDWAGFTV